MNKSHLVGAACAVLFTFTTLSAKAALVGIFPATPGGTDYQAVYDDVAVLTWLANANAAGTTMNWVDLHMTMETRLPPRRPMGS